MIARKQILKLLFLATPLYLMAAAKPDAPKDAGDNDLPPELRGASGDIDPASFLNKNDVEQSDFGHVKQELERTRKDREQGWAEQDKQEAEFQKLKDAEAAAEKAKAEKEAQEAEAKRQQAIRDADRAEAERLKRKKDAEAEVARLPGISKDEQNWNGLD